MTIKTIETWQGIAGFFVITLGLVPLFMLAFGAPTGGLWGLVLDEDAGPLVWICPCLAVFGGVVAIALWERRKQ